MPDLDDRELLALLDLTFDALCARRASELVDPARLLPTLDRLLSPERVQSWPGRALALARARLLERAAGSRVKLGAWLPPDVTATLADLAGQPVRIPRKAIDELVTSEQMRDTVRATLQETLSAFVNQLTTSGPGAVLPGGLRDALGWGARAAAAASKGFLGGLGSGVQGVVRDVVDASMAMVQRRVAERLASEDTARALGKRRRQLFLGLLEKTEAEAAQALSQAPHERFDPLLPRVLVHNLARPEVREGLLAGARGAVEALSGRTVGELLDGLGLREPAREALRAHGLPVARSLVGSAPFQAWLERAAGPRSPARPERAPAP